jgi:hypothetical protein
MKQPLYRATRDYTRFKRRFSSRFFGGDLGFFEFVASFFKLRSLLKRRSKAV